MILIFVVRQFDFTIYHNTFMLFIPSALVDMIYYLLMIQYMYNYISSILLPNTSNP